MTGNRIKPETNRQIKTLSEKGDSTRQIATRLRLANVTVPKSINNFKSTGKYRYKKPTGRPKCTTKLLDDAIILSLKKSSKKTAEVIQAALPQDVVLPSQRTICRRLFRANLKFYRPSKKPKLSQKNIADSLACCQKYQA